MRHLLSIFLLLASPLHAQEVDVELVLMADASGSIDSAEIVFQRQGYAEAITDPSVLSAIRGNLTGSIAVAYVEWAADQAVVVDWTIIDSPETAAGFAAALLGPPRLASGRNAIGAALLEGQRLIEGNQFTGLRRVIDFSGDSVGNFSGPSIADARAAVIAAGITINGLPIVCESCDDGLADIYTEQIIGGPGAFVLSARGRANFADAVRRKLVLEIAGITPRIAAAAP